jgi:hypothetical protein
MSSSTHTRVYFVENIETGRIKVGFTTSSVNKRVAQLQTGSDCELRLLGVVLSEEDHGTTERQLHLRFAEWHHRGEWFSPQILPLVRELLRLAQARSEQPRG